MDKNLKDCEFIKNVLEIRDKPRQHFPDLSQNIILKKTINKKLSKKQLLSIFYDFTEFCIKNNTFVNPCDYYGKFTPEIIENCFEHYPETFDKNFFLMINNFKKQKLYDKLHLALKENKESIFSIDCIKILIENLVNKNQIK